MKFMKPTYGPCRLATLPVSQRKHSGVPIKGRIVGKRVRTARGEANAALGRKEEKFEHFDEGERNDARLKNRVGGFMSDRYLHGLSIVISDNKS